jgi:hypothetical protein
VEGVWRDSEPQIKVIIHMKPFIWWQVLKEGMDQTRVAKNILESESEGRRKVGMSRLR